MDALTTFASAVVACMMGYLLGTRSGDAFANKVLETARQTVEICNDAIERCSTLVDEFDNRYKRLASDYRRLFDAYDEAYRILEENGLVGGQSPHD